MALHLRASWATAGVREHRWEPVLHATAKLLHLQNKIFSLKSLRWARLGRRPESYLSGEDCLSKEVALHLGASFRAILIRGGGPGTSRAAHRQEWFWVLLPKQKGLVARGRNPAEMNHRLIIMIHRQIFNNPPREAAT